jgi:eukaryotic-like serine/threonine-protein kinase
VSAESSAEIPLFQSKRIDEICDRFEQALRDGQRPLIEDYLDDFQGPARARLLRKLILLDLANRDASDEHGLRTEYNARFPHDPDAVKRAFGEFLTRGADPARGSDSLTRTGGPSFEPSVTVPAAFASTDAAGCAETLINAASSPAARELPRKLGRYEVQEVIGRGGFGTVFKAYDPEFDRLVAIKVPHPEILSRPQIVDAYLTEAKALARLDHPGIVPFYDSGRTEDGSCYLVSKFIEGRSFAEMIPEVAGTPRRFTEIVPAVVAVASALHYAHKQGLVHCDIKPANLLIGTDGQPLVVDFGLAVVEEEQRSLPHVTAGTPYYMSPEQVRGERHRFDGRTDIWSLGAVLYEAVTNRRPFGGETAAQILDEILHREPKPPRMIDDTIPAPLEAIILRCLCKNVTDRYATAGDLASALRSRSRSTRAFGSMSPERLAELSQFVSATTTRKASPSDWSWGLRDLLEPRMIALIALAAALVITLCIFVYQFSAWTLKSPSERNKAPRHPPSVQKALDSRPTSRRTGADPAAP